MLNLMQLSEVPLSKNTFRYHHHHRNMCVNNLANASKFQLESAFEQAFRTRELLVKFRRTHMQNCINGQILIACMAIKTAKYCPHNSINAKRKWQGRKHEQVGEMRIKMWPAAVGSGWTNIHYSWSEWVSERANLLMLMFNEHECLDWWHFSV